MEALLVLVLSLALLAAALTVVHLALGPLVRPVARAVEAGAAQWRARDGRG